MMIMRMNGYCTFGQGLGGCCHYESFSRMDSDGIESPNPANALFNTLGIAQHPIHRGTANEPLLSVNCR